MWSGSFCFTYLFFTVQVGGKRGHEMLEQRLPMEYLFDHLADAEETPQPGLLLQDVGDLGGIEAVWVQTE